MSSIPAVFDVRVTFPLSKEPPFNGDLTGSTTVGEVLALALAHFKVTPDPQASYYLTLHGVRPPETESIDHVATGEEKQLPFRLVKELIQG
jgi:hypothetical protein